MPKLTAEIVSAVTISFFFPLAAIADSINWARASRDMCVNWNKLQTHLACASSDLQPDAMQLPGVQFPLVIVEAKSSLKM